ncbi:MAG: choice-of-anchor J domain-containing protein, partial [Flavobacteriales bacterium]|nr:choice-of-anchor J domain-containing protein [Flavobacteriales bacterium]
MTTPRSATLQLLLASSFISAAAYGQANCLFNETFEGESLPAGWSMAPEAVERLDANGVGTGQFTAPFSVGGSAQANSAGYFPVPNLPAGNRFALANDDAPPCDCALDQVGLISPTIDLTTAVAPAVSFRYYHDGRPFNGRAWVDLSTNGSDWSTLMELAEEVGAWQYTSIDLSSYVGGSISLRFRYDDGDDWASGFALDDLCVF